MQQSVMEGHALKNKMPASSLWLEHLVTVLNLMLYIQQQLQYNWHS